MRIVRLALVRDEADILERNIDWYARAGVITVLVDNGSTDGSREIARAALADGHIAALDTIDTPAFEWDILWRRAIELAFEQRPDWLLVTGIDEFFEVADGSPLRAALEADADAGYNLVKFHNMEFWMTPRDPVDEPDLFKRVRYYSPFDVVSYRAYPAVPGIDLLAQHLHRPIFPRGIEDRPSPRRYVSRHYKIRSIEQGQRKIRRMRPTLRLPGANTHYLKYAGKAEEFVIEGKGLHFYAEDHAWRFDQVYDGGRARAEELPALMRRADLVALRESLWELRARLFEPAVISETDDPGTFHQTWSPRVLTPNEQREAHHTLTLAVAALREYLSRS